MPTLKADAPFKGLNTLLDPSKLGPTEAAVALNVNLDKGTIKKRAGFTNVYNMSATTKKILGIHDFRRDDEGKIVEVNHIFKYGAKLFRSINAATPVELQLSSSDAFENEIDIASFVTHEDKAFFVDNGDTETSADDAGYIRVTDGLTVHSAIIARPTAPDVSGMGLAGVTNAVMEGRYNYKFTWYSEAWDIESGASDPLPSTVNSATGHVEHEGSISCRPGSGVVIEDIPEVNSADSRVSHVRIYRKNLDGHALWHKVAQFTLAEAVAMNDATPAGFVDSLPDSDLNSQDIAPFSLDIKFPIPLRLIEEHNNQIFASGDDTVLYFSNAFTPLSLTDNIVVGGESEAGKITGLVSWKGKLIIFKQHSIWEMTGSTQEDISFNEVVSGSGCFAPHSIIPTENAIYFLGEDGFYYFDGKSASLISRSISPDIQGRNYLRDNFVVGVDNKEDRALIWAVSTGTSTVNDTCFVLFYGNSPEVKGPSWTKWQFVKSTDAAMDIQSMARVTLNEATADRLVFYGAGNLKIGKLVDGAGDDETGDFLFQWRTGKWDAGFPHREKHWQEVYFEQRENSSDATYTVNYLRDTEAAEAGKATSIATTMPVNFIRLRERSRDISLEFLAPTTKEVEIVTFSLRAEVAGRADR
jgi:hypothetical protein